MQSTDWTPPPLSLYIYYGMGGPLILYISTQECAQTHVYININVYLPGVPNGDHFSKCLLLNQNG